MRKLVPCTIIPPELYVQREADRQLRRVINDTGRPACVLVARQMGKTNLLLNAKRELEDRNNAFVYVDLSIPLSTDRDCFRHIVDVALESHQQVFGTCKGAISSSREKDNLPPYKEHEFELRALLSAISGKLVIILDEIDSLAKVPFSDRIFSQIRSVYFSRVNYPQFNRLTYVLSGVLEPNEIIKDKRISPFNIAEKIYLNDFNESEYQDFISRSGLQIKDEIKARIYHWASGNPRITWDICADLEEKIAKGHLLTEQEVDWTVQKIYLTDYNQAPVDHIREVVAGDDDLRNAITVIKFGKGETLSDEAKNKLYLAGIVSASNSYKGVKIKNKVIEASLSDQWLHDIGVKRKGLLKLAEEKFEAEKYGDALALYEQYAAKDQIPQEKLAPTYYNMGCSAYHIGEFEKAIRYLEHCKWDKQEAAVLYYEKKLMLGVSHLSLGQIDLSQSAFQEVLASPRKDSRYLSALFNSGAVYTAVQDYPRAIATLQQAIDETKQTDMNLEEKSRLITAAYFNLGTTFQKAGDNNRAKEYFEKALNHCLVEQKPAILLGLVQICKIKRDKGELFAKCAQHIIENKLRPIPPDPAKVLALTRSHLITTLMGAFEFEPSQFRPLLEYAESIEEGNLSQRRILLQLAIYSARQRKIENAVALAETALDRIPQNKTDPPEVAFEALRLLCYVTKGVKQRPHSARFIEELKTGYKPARFSYLDVSVISDELDHFIQQKELKKAQELIQLSKRYLPLMSPEEAGTFGIIYLNEMAVLSSARNRLGVRQAAQECLEFIGTLAEANGADLLLGPGGLDQLKKVAEEQIQPQPKLKLSPEEPRELPKFEPNEKITVKYRDGTVREDVKFKRVKSDLKSGLCELLPKKS